MSVLVYFRQMFKDSRRNNNLDELSTGFGRTPLHLAVMSGDERFARNILYSRPDLALIEDNRGWTPLHLASARASFKMVKLLLNAEPTACMVKDRDERTPLHLAVMNDRINVVELLMEKRPDAIHLKKQDGETILHFCVKSTSCIQTLELLLDKLALARISDPSIIINSEDNSGKTVLKLAAETEKIEMVQCLVESNSLKLEISDVAFAEALNTLSPENRNDLETKFLKYLGHDHKKHKSKTLSKIGDKHKGHKHKGIKERANALMVVATLIAGIAFQAAMNPPGGVWQDDAKVDSSTDPARFSYYLQRMFGPSISGGLDRYIQDFLNAGWDSDMEYRKRGDDFLRSLLNVFGAYYVQTTKGLILYDSQFIQTVSTYNNSHGHGQNYSYPYLIRYAGYPILAYTFPINYVVYMVTNGVALFVSLVIIFLVICGFMIETSATQVRFLVLLMCISIGCIASSYVSILQAMVPGFYIEGAFNSYNVYFVLQVFFGACCIFGVGYFIWIELKTIKRRKGIGHYHIGAINYVQALFRSMDAKATGKLILFIISYLAFRVTGYIYYDSWRIINRFLY